MGLRKLQSPYGEELIVRMVDGLAFDKETPIRVAEGLAKAYKEKLRVRLFYGSPVLGRDSLEMYNVTGHIKPMSIGYPIPLLVTSLKARLGVAIRDTEVVRLLVGGEEYYRLPYYHLPEFVIQPQVVAKPGGGYKNAYGVYAIYPNTAPLLLEYSGTMVKAENLIDFLKGKSDYK